REPDRAERGEQDLERERERAQQLELTGEPRREAARLDAARHGEAPPEQNEAAVGQRKERPQREEARREQGEAGEERDPRLVVLALKAKAEELLEAGRDERANEIARHPQQGRTEEDTAHGALARRRGPQRAELALEHGAPGAGANAVPAPVHPEHEPNQRQEQE